MKKRLLSLVPLALLGVGALAAPASAAPPNQLSNTLGQLWTTVLETPTPQNAFGSGDPATGCWNLGGALAPLGPSGVPECTVKPGTKLFEIGNTVECSTFEGNGTTEAELRNCARAADKSAPPVTLDGRTVPLTETTTGPLHITLPADNLFGLPAGTTGLSVGDGWVAQLHPLTPGTHTVVIGSGPSAITTLIHVQPGA
ncbi:MAG: hypothetical protein QOJ32_2510 [Frankiaceae bacterium]|nr:hypothetical protein [Frankiaceae bacterium]